MKRRHLALLAVGLFALGVRFLYIRQISGAPFFDLRLGDADAYHQWARRIAAGDWLGSGVFYQSPLYPYFLALVYRIFDDSVLTVRIIHALLSAGSCVLLARRSLLAGLALAIYPPAIFLDLQLDKTVLVTFLLCALLTVRRAWQAGILLGLLVIARENTVILLCGASLRLAMPAVVPAVPSRRQTAIMIATCLAVLLPVGLRNLVRGGEFHLTTAQSGPNFYIGNHPGASGTYDPLIAGHGSAADERDDATRLAEQARGRSLTPGEVSTYWTGRALTYIRDYPVDWLRLTGRKLALLLNNSELADTEAQSVYADWSWLLRIPFGFAVVLALAIAAWRPDRLLWSMAATYAVSVAAFYVVARYRLPLVPILLLLALPFPLRRPRPIAAAAALAAFLIALLPLADPRPARATTYHAIATAFSKDPARLDDAASFYRRALEVDPDFPGAHFGLATVLTKERRFDDAIPHYRSAVGAWPGHEELRYNFGQALAATGRVDDAVQQFSEAVRLRPDDPDAHLALGISLMKLARRDEALPHLERAVQLNPADDLARRALEAARP